MGNDLLFDAIGAVGVVVGLSAYFLLQAEKIRADELRYSLLNLVGASLIAISLLWRWNFAAFLLEAAWILISIYGIVKWYQRRQGTLHDRHR